ncbi:hypothetical protein BC830DRAFT_1221825, partial [Chytriomyces sp. MP71]
MQKNMIPYLTHVNLLLLQIRTEMATQGTSSFQDQTETAVTYSPPVPLSPLPEFWTQSEGTSGILARVRRNSSVNFSLNRNGKPSVQIINFPPSPDLCSEALGTPFVGAAEVFPKNSSFRDETKNTSFNDEVTNFDKGCETKVDRYASADDKNEQANVDSEDEDYWAIDTQEDEFKNVGTVERIQNIVFSVLFSMAHGNNAGALLEYGTDIVEDLQLTAFLLAPEFTVAYWLPPWLVAASNADFQTMELNQYEVYFFLAIASVILLVVNMIFVAVGIMRGKQVSMFPIKLLRFLATVLPTVLYIPIFEVLVSVLTCNHVIPRGPDDVMTLENTSCSNPTRWPLVVISIIALLVYVPTGVSLAAV